MTKKELLTDLRKIRERIETMYGEINSLCISVAANGIQEEPQLELPADSHSFHYGPEISMWYQSPQAIPFGVVLDKSLQCDWFIVDKRCKYVMGHVGEHSL